MKRVVELYEKLPKGQAPESKGTGLIGRYRARYFNGENASSARKLKEMRRKDWS
jgi:F-type H+-transporting ATPase subunit f